MGSATTSTTLCTHSRFSDLRIRVDEICAGEHLDRMTGLQSEKISFFRRQHDHRRL